MDNAKHKLSRIELIELRNVAEDYQKADGKRKVNMNAVGRMLEDLLNHIELETNKR